MQTATGQTEPLDDSAPCSLRELCVTFVIEESVVIEMVDIGVLIPLGDDPHSWKFGAGALLRLQRARRLQRDLEINLAGVAVALDLLDELEGARQRVKTLEQHLALLTAKD